MRQRDVCETAFCGGAFDYLCELNNSHQAPAKRNAAVARATAAFTNSLERETLNDVDLGRQVRGHLEADFLLTNSGLGPGLHDLSPPNCVAGISNRLLMETLYRPTCTHTNRKFVICRSDFMIEDEENSDRQDSVRRLPVVGGLGVHVDRHREFDGRLRGALHHTARQLDE